MIQEGKPGEQRLTKLVTKINGEVSDEEIISAITIVEPIIQVEEIPPK
ncbi:MAG: G5 domain-containing protein [Clostridiales bacterium]|nr:G5 domain-containing protein [Clostridiales bacterium]